MTVSVTPVDVGTVEGDNTGDKARVAFQSINANEANFKASIESLEGRFWTVQNSTLNPLVIGQRYMANNHAGITFTTPASFTLSATAVSDIWVTNADDASNITLTPASGDAFFVDGVTNGVDTTYAVTPGNLVILSPRTTDSEWDLIVAGGAGGWADMTEAVWAGGTQSEVADGASAVAFDFDTDNAYSTAGANLARFSNNGTAVFDFSYQGGIDHANSGASTAAHSQSLNLNWTGSTTQTSSGQYSCVIGAQNTASSLQAIAIGQLCKSTNTRAVCLGYNSTASGNSSFVIGTSCTSSGTASGAFGSGASVTGNYSYGFGLSGSTANNATIALGGSDVGGAPAQAMFSALYALTTDATQTTLGANSTDYVIPADTSWAFSALIIARSDETDGNDSAAYKIEGLLTRDESNNTALVGSITKTVIAESAGATAWDVTAEADDTNEALAIKVTGEAATNIRWVCKLDIAQVVYA